MTTRPTFLFATLALGLLVGLTVLQGQRPGSCYGFIRDGAIGLHCTRETIMTSDLGIEDFAVSPDGKYLAIKRKTLRSSEQPRPQQAYSDIKLVDLMRNKSSDIARYPDALFESCGKLLVFSRGSGTFDLISKETFVSAPYSFVRCSANRAVKAGYISEKPLSVGSVPLRTGQRADKLLSESSAYMAFDVSPNGHYIAYSVVHEAAPDAICMVAGDRTPVCIRNLVLTGGIISVSDVGEVLIEQSTADECIYQDPFHFSRGGRNGNRDACVAIFSWQEGKPAPEKREDLGRRPQWIPQNEILQEWIRRGGQL